MASWFSRLTQAMFPSVPGVSGASVAQDLVETVEKDRKMLQMASSLSGSLSTDGLAHIATSLPVRKDATHTIRGQSSLSPFASRILERAKIESLKSDEERTKFTSPAQLFATGAAKERVGHIESIAFEKSKHQADTFIHASKPAQPSAFASFMKSAKNSIKR